MWMFQWKLPYLQKYIDMNFDKKKKMKSTVTVGSLNKFL